MPVVVDSVARGRVLRCYHGENPRQGAEWQDWLERTADSVGLTCNQVQRIVAEEEQAYLSSLRARSETNAQRVANRMGVTMASALQAIRDGLEATRRRVVKNRAGDPVLDADGNVTYDEQPDHPVRLAAAVHAIKIQGMYAPQQVEINENVTITDMSASQLNSRIRDVLVELSNLVEAGPQADAGGRGAAGRIDGPAGASGQVVLADAVHEDEG